MRLSISSLMGRKGDFFQVKKELPSEFIEAAPEVSHVLGPLYVDLTVTNTGEGYLVTGDLSLDVALHCSRCLKPLQTTLQTSVEEEFLLHPRERDEEFFWDAESLVEGNELDTTSLIEESILISIPMKTVCQTDCPGLCSTCGADLAEGGCTCPDPSVDIRLAPLSQLLQTVSETTTSERRKEHGTTKKKKLKSKD